MNSDFDTAELLDTCGTRCPIPLLRAKTALKKLEVGQYLEVLATDPSAKPDFDAMLKHLPHKLVSYRRQEQSDANYPWVDIFIIQKG